MHDQLARERRRRAPFGALAALFGALVASTAQAEVSLTYAGPPVAIPDNQPDGVNVGLSVAGLQAIVDIDVRFQGTSPCDALPGNTTAAVVHTGVGDLVLTLTSPQGTTVTLINRRAGTRENICNLILNDEGNLPSLASVTSVSGQTLIGSFMPDQPLSAFDGESPNGVWTVNISDRLAGNTGTFRQFTLVLETVPIDIAVDVLDDPTPSSCTPGSCSLREAVQLANAQAGPNRIVLPAGTFNLTRAGAGDNANSTGDLDITDDLVIDGAGDASTIITQTTADRVLHVFTSGVSLSLVDLGITGGSAVTDGGALSMSGAGLLRVERSRFFGNRATRHGGAIQHTGGGGSGVRQIILSDCRFEDNRATNLDATDAYGGALYSLSSGFSDVFLRIENCSFSNNRADNGGGALGLDGVQSVSGNRGTIIGSTFTQNQVTDSGRGGAIGTNVEGMGLFSIDLLDTVFEQNSAPSGSTTNQGGALSIYSGQATVRGSLFTGNTAGAGGAIAGALVSMDTSTLCGNSAVNSGGGLQLDGAAAILSRSTLCNNVVTTSDVAQFGGGAVAKPTGDLTLERNTIDGNVAVRGAGIAFGGNDLILRGNTIVAPSPLPAGALGSVMRYTNTDTADSLFLYNNILIGQCSYTSTLNPGVALSNIEASGNTCRLLLAVLQAGNQIAVAGNAINLGALADHGGPTDTRLPQAPSIAIDMGSNTACTPLDQRGFQRNDAQCDVGSVEVGGTLPPEVMLADGFE
jgi:subtilisin-like proprotein convertase family protein